MGIKINSSNSIETIKSCIYQLKKEYKDDYSPIAKEIIQLMRKQIDLLKQGKVLAQESEGLLKETENGQETAKKEELSNKMIEHSKKQKRNLKKINLMFDKLEETKNTDNLTIN